MKEKQDKMSRETMTDEKVLIDALEEIVYVSDPETYELLYINEQGKKALGLGGNPTGKCYHLIQMKDSPCEFCTTSVLNFEDFYVWEYTNPRNGRHYLLKDKLIRWHGKDVRMELAVDITDKENTSRAVRNKLTIEQTLVDCIRMLSSDSDMDRAVQMVLAGIGEFHQADRAYLFEIDKERDRVSNTYEWCAEGVNPEKENLQNLTLRDIGHWLEMFKKDGSVVIEELEQVKGQYPREYEILKPQGIESVIVVPLTLKGSVLGFIGVDNPRSEIKDSSLLDSLSYFVINSMQERRMEQQLRVLSYHDGLTNLYNRNRYIRYLAKRDPQSLKSAGAIFIDVNGLKRTNDTYGHGAGDAVIVGIARILKRHFQEDGIYRIGGDEFVVFCENSDWESFENKVEGLKREFHRHRQYKVSVGYHWADRDIDLRELARTADRLMYLDKQSYYHEMIGDLVENGSEGPCKSGDEGLLSEDCGSQKEIRRRMLQYGVVAREYCDEIYEVNLTKNTMSRVGRINGRLLECPTNQSYDEVILYANENLVHPEDRKNFSRVFQPEQIKAYFSGDAVELNFDYRRLNQQGKYIWVSAAFKRIRYPEGFEDASDLTFLFLLKDIDELVSERERARSREYRYSLALQNICELICELEIATDTYHVTMNQDYIEELPEYGCYSKELEKLAQNRIDPRDRKRWLANMRLSSLMDRFLREGVEAVQFDYRIIDRKGESRWRHNKAIYLAGDGICGDSILIIANDTEAQKQAEQWMLDHEFTRREAEQRQELRSQEARYITIVERSGSGVFEWSLDDHAFETLVGCGGEGSIYVSEQLRKQFDFDRAEMDFLTFLIKKDKVHPEDREAFWRFITRLVSEEYQEITCRLTCDGERYYWYRVGMNSVYDAHGKRERIIGSLTDVDQELRRQEAFQKRAERDPLTGIYNQAAFYNRMDRMLEAHPDRRFAVIMMDIDKFKVVNDLYGMDGGNRALRDIAGVLEACLKDQGLCTRMYADVFCIFTECRERSEVERLILQILNGIRKTEFGPALTPYFGICNVERSDQSAVQLCEMAGFAHKAAKGSRSRRLLFYDDTMRQRLLTEKRIEDEMEHALKSGQFKVYLQPKYDLFSEKVVGAEALVRWEHPEEGMIAPDQFVPLFEKNGFIIELDHFVWDEACRELRSWLDLGFEPLPISVNVSRLHLRGYDLEQEVKDAADRRGIPHRLLELELTESLFFENLDHLRSVLNMLRKDGFVLNMDDFGSGYSSLNMLKDISVDTLKIDSGFFNETVSTEKGKTVIRHTVTMAKELNMKVVAEGVENQEEVDFLKEIGCSEIQGYYISAPIPMEEFEHKFLRSRS